MIQQGTLKCNRVGHNDDFVQAVCMKKGCHEPIPCCNKCIIKEHRNHKQTDFVEISEIKGQAYSSLEHLNQLAQLSQSICEVCQSWKKEIQKLIDQLRGKHQLSENPTLTQLSNYVIRVREKKVDQQEAELVQIFKNQMTFIQERLTQLQNEVNELVKYQVGIEEKFNQQSVIQGKIVNLDNLKFTLTQQLQGHYGEVGYVAISNDDKYIASSAFPSIVILWDVKSHQQIAQYKTLNLIITALHFSNDNSMLAVSSLQGIGGDGIEIFDLTNLNNTQAKIKLEGHYDSITRITFTDDSKYLISVSNDQSLRVWDLNKKKEINKQECDDMLQGVAYSHQQKMIACCGQNGFCYLFDSKNLNNLQLIVKWQAHSQYSGCIEFIRNSTIIMTSNPQETRFWQIEDLLNKKFNHFKEIKEGGWTVKAYPIDNPQVIINCSSDKRFVNLWSYDSTELIQRLEIPDKLFEQSFAINSDFKKIITGGCNKKVNIFHQENYESGLRRIQ